MGAKALLLFSLMLSLSFAYSLDIKVTVSQDTLAVGTNVSIVKDGVEMALQKANSDGKASFSLPQGSYFVLLRRGGYPLHVSLVEVSGNSNLTLTMRQTVSYASAYGQVFGPSAPSAVIAYSGGNIVKRATTNADGLYLISFLPEGQYDLAFESEGYQSVRKQVFLPSSDFTQLNAELAASSNQTQLPVEMSTPVQVQQFSTIQISLKKGDAPVAGKEISVQTPSGVTTITTGADGQAKVNAAEPGIYIFTYEQSTATTKVNAASPSVEPNQTAPPPAAEEPAAPPASQDNGGQLFAALALVGIFVAIAAIAAAIGLKLFGSKAKKKKHRE